MNIINLTQHQATVEQVTAGVVDLSGNALTALKDNLTFINMPDKKAYVKGRKELHHWPLHMALKEP